MNRINYIVAGLGIERFSVSTNWEKRNIEQIMLNDLRFVYLYEPGFSDQLQFLAVRLRRTARFVRSSNAEIRALLFRAIRGTCLEHHSVRVPDFGVRTITDELAKLTKLI